jgi:hypothetical protein
VRGVRAAALTPWLPALVCGVAVVAVLRYYGTPVPVSLWYAVHAFGTTVLPGALVWRLVRHRRVTITEDATMGAALGAAIHVLVSLALAPVHLSHLAWVWAVVVVAGSLAPRFRRRAWCRSPRGTSSAAAWWQAGAVTAAVVWIGSTAFSRNPVTFLGGRGPWTRGAPTTAYVDLPFHHAIAANIESVFPFVFPYLYDEPLSYHYFVYLHLAGSSSSSGIDLTWLIYRLAPVSLTVLALLLVGVLARRLSSRSAAAPLAVVVAAVSGPLNLYGWTTAPFQNPGFLNFTTYRSPTQTFGTPIFLACAVVATLVLRSPLTKRQVPALAVFTVLVFTAAGAKSTFVPVLVCGLLLATTASAALRLRRWRPGLALLVITASSLLFMTVVVLGGESGSLSLRPLGLVRSLGLTHAVTDGTSTAHLAVVGGLAVAAWWCGGAGVVLLLRRRTLRDPAAWLLVGLVIAGASGAMLAVANGLSQLYFLYAAWPFLSVLTAWGIALAAPAQRPAWWFRVAATAVAGAVIAWLVARRFTVAPTPVEPTFPFRAVLGPWAWFALAVVVACGIAYVSTRPGRRRGVVALTAVCLLVGGSALPRSEAVVAAVGAMARGTGAPDPATPGYALLTDAGDLSYNAYVPVPPDGARAALYVRDHAAPGDAVVTNAHCYGEGDRCESRHFWVSALTERRTVVEGWAYPEGFRPGLTRTSPYWDQVRFTLNERVFTAPDAAVLEELVTTYRARWILVDRTQGVESPELRGHADLVLELDGAAVYRVR